jgi:hypothetical protein
LNGRVQGNKQSWKAGSNRANDWPEDVDRSVAAVLNQVTIAVFVIWD